ncbi:MAG TPA: polyprenyl synthetase family protein [Anaerohalosphaeraceae bacterium]|nr:polyprenyl synthetase family protein [Anaerohalosphaeraceae bacterium]HQG05410.1 polyprenyl synthetase family protein [Anaerohalosphaeraceae bacterium]HQI06783.1 polyprenyl synthetase family protein [Anaerohalosphaeraceae bacterium]HQJ67204.1 polyprenyl synthetase family protein [Anaerohalosphaeraceae bacterium]
MDVQNLEKRIVGIDFSAELTECARQADRTIRRLLEQQSDIPARLKEAMVYTALSPGKRIRAAVVQWCCRTVSGRVNADAQTAAAAVEMVHTYSLIHDDLPAMDDDDFRRGRPSCHKQFDEATAILTGDALLTLAFEVLADEIENPPTAVQMVRVLAKAAGPAGMIAGQIKDLESQGTEGTMSQLQSIHLCKTGQMFAAAAELGAIAGGASEPQRTALRQYGLDIGLGFQIADDLLDVSATSEQLGKTAGKDSRQGKLTYPALVGIEKARQIAEQIAEKSLQELSSFGPEADILRRLVFELLNRKR